MTAQIISLGGADEEDGNYNNFIESLKSDNESVIYLVKKSDGQVCVGSTFTDRRDLVFALYQLQGLAHNFVGGAE